MSILQCTDKIYLTACDATRSAPLVTELPRSLRRLVNYSRLIALLFLVPAFQLHGQPSRVEFGVHATDLLNTSGTTLARVAQLLDSAHVKWLRINISWEEIQPDSGVWNWSDLQQRMAFLRFHNLRIIGLLHKTPRWASSAPPNTDSMLVRYYAPRDTNEWVTFVDSTLGRFVNTISHWEVWGEPDGGGLRVAQPLTKHIEYVKILRTAYRTIKQRDSTASVLLGGLTSSIAEPLHRRFLDSILTLGAGQFFDIMNIHVYFDIDTVMGTLRAALAEHNLQKPIWVTETNNWRSLLPMNTEQRSADSLATWLSRIRRHEPEMISWFNLTDFTARGPDSVAWGLFRQRTFDTTLVFSAYKNYISSVITQIGNKESRVPERVLLLQNYPNPFNSTTIIRYELPIDAYVVLRVYNALGQEVATLVRGELNAGEHSVNFNAEWIPSGVYFAQMKAGDVVQRIKMMVVK